ncbi:hypothetical protein C922_02844 [Plasmodium inui San Antonio 1]|uniref:Uncharacterized protein n=1 Tax=Plasmodium inui San Antonio 1 TaxID=1237626 RepID=W7ACM9_9APIC|nr:hypothetical protein C922_02844 [Plasmodium inui San Antonio 1]EUD66859.1 hypothetical protein C922_02844 [Plasmodium inui San Antonio 1]
MALQKEAEKSSDLTSGKDDERRKHGKQEGDQKDNQEGDQEGGQKGDQKGGQKRDQKGGKKDGQKGREKNGQKDGEKYGEEGHQKDGQKINQKGNQKNDRQGDCRGNPMKSHRVKPSGGTTKRVPDEAPFIEKTRKHYLDNVNKTLHKRDINCVSYVYKNMNDRTTSKNVPNSVKLGGAEDRVDAVRQMLFFEKQPRKNRTIGASGTSAVTGAEAPCAKDDETVQSIIYSTFINTNWRQTQNHAAETVKKPPKGKLPKRPPEGKDKKGNYASSGKRFYAKGSEVNPPGTNQSVDAYRGNLTAPVTTIVCTNKSVQITESNEQLKNLKNDGTFLYEQIISEKERKKKERYTQTSSLYQAEEIRRFAKYLTKQIVNEATIQLTYEENVKAMEQKKKAVQLIHLQNVQTYSHLTDFQRDNLGVMADGAELFRCLDIFNKINIFGLSGSLINSIVRKNVQSAKEQNNRAQIEWHNQVTKNLLKNTIAFVATEKIVSYIAEELIEDCILNFCRIDKRDVDILTTNLDDHNISLYERRRMESGHFNFVLSNGNLNVNMPVRVKKHMSLEDLLRMIKNHIKKKLHFLRKEYELDFLSIRDGTRNITSIHDLLSSESSHFTLCLNKKEGEAIPSG